MDKRTCEYFKCLHVLKLFWIIAHMKDFFAGLVGGIRELKSPGAYAVSCFAQVYDADSDIIDFSCIMLHL